MAISKGTQYITDPSSIPVNNSTGLDQALSESLDARVVRVETLSELGALSPSNLKDGQAVYVNEVQRAYKWSSANSRLEDFEYDIIIGYGQSNMVGFAGQPGTPAVDDDATPTPEVRALQYDPASDSIITISNTMNHLNYVDEGTSSRGNAWTAFSNRYIDLTGRGVVFVNAGRGGKSVAELSKGAGSGVTDYYQVLLDGYASTKAAMTASNYKIGKTYLIWHQGETDQQNGTSHTTYRDSLNTLIGDLFTDIPELSRFGVCIVGCPDSRPQESWQRIQSAQYAAVAYSNGAGFTDTAAIVYEGCPTFRLADGQYNPVDGTHYSQRGYNQMGEGVADGLSQWALRSTRSGSGADERRRLGVEGVGYLSVQMVSGIAKYDGSWSLQRKSNTALADAYYPSYIERIDTVSGDTVRFVMSGKAPVTYSYDVQVGDTLLENHIHARISKYTATDEWGFDVKFYGDLYFGVTTDTAAIFDGNPLGAASAYTTSIISASTDGTTTTVTHPATKQPPEGYYYSTSGAEPGSVGVRSISNTQTLVENSGPNSVVALALRNINITLSQIQNLGSFDVRILAHVSDDI